MKMAPSKGLRVWIEKKRKRRKQATLIFPFSLIPVNSDVNFFSLPDVPSHWWIRSRSQKNFSLLKCCYYAFIHNDDKDNQCQLFVILQYMLITVRPQKSLSCVKWALKGAYLRMTPCYIAVSPHISHGNKYVFPLWKTLTQTDNHALRSSDSYFVTIISI